MLPLQQTHSSTAETNSVSGCQLQLTTATTTTTTTTVLWPPGLCLGLLGWASTRKVKPIWIYWSKR